MQIKLVIIGASESELRALLAAHSQVVEYESVGPQPVNYGGKHRGRPHVGLDGPEKYGVETFPLTPIGAATVLDRIAPYLGMKPGPVVCDNSLEVDRITN